MMRRWLAAAGVCALSAGAQAAELKIADIKASLYLEATGKFSEALTDAAALDNLAKGDGPDHRLASAVLIELTFSGEKNAAPKFATATVDVIQTNHAGQASVTHKGFTHFVFGPDGLEHKAFLIEDATCMPLRIEVRANKSVKTLSLPFHCGG
jgi:hypothetical protein